MIFFLKPIVALDRETNNITNIIETDDYFHFQEDAPVVFTKLSCNLYSGSTSFTNLSQGSHNVTIGVVANVNLLSYGYPAGYFYTTIHFNVDSIPPCISILPMQNKTYSTDSIPINFTVNKALSKISYSVDGTENISAPGNFTLGDLPAGNHNITIYATDEVGNIGSQTANFVVETPHSETFGTALILVVIVVPVAIVCATAGLVLLRRRRKNTNGRF